MVEEVLAKAPELPDGTYKKILVVGDSWAALVGAGSEVGGVSFLERKLKEHGCRVGARSIAVPGTETGDWAVGDYKTAMQRAAKGHDYVFIILAGNDALDRMPDCAEEEKSAQECGDELMVSSTANMYTIVDAIHDANPAARIVGFGYDTMFGGLGCSFVTHDIFPQCWGKHAKIGTGNRCFNTQFIRIQEMWDTVAANRSFVDSASILGATQVAAGDTKASTGPDRHIDMDKMGPAKYWPDYEACFHPGVLGGEDSGAMVVMEEFYKVYWSKQPACANTTDIIV